MLQPDPSPGSLSSTGSLSCYYALEHQLHTVPPAWVYDPRTEFARMGIEEGKKSGWRVSHSINADYEVSPTYARTLCIPATASDDLLRGSAGFRSKGRFPVLCWRCAKT